ncbi:hypothetical protein ABEB36_013290 [Hypothenemus hampei]|uniref:Gem-associated protein 5 n=1 Tax=Hypothenemus hampei TaxID=57062 RepID=A0ABD1E7H7_HYPHA
MDKLVIPPSPNWYQTDIMACAPDNTIIYGAQQDIVIIKPTAQDLPDNVCIIPKAHFKWIHSVSVNKNWGAPNKYLASISAEDRIVKLWDVESLKKKASHNKHVTLSDESRVVGVAFAGDDRVVSTSENGTVIVWNILKNETVALNNLFSGRKVFVTALSVCPHATWMAAFGMKSGLITLVDLRQMGQVLYNLRGHGQMVISLSWCPAPINIFPKKPNNHVVEKKLRETLINKRKKTHPSKITSTFLEGFWCKSGIELTEDSNLKLKRVGRNADFHLENLLLERQSLESAELPLDCSQSLVDNTKDPSTSTETISCSVDMCHSTVNTTNIIEEKNNENSLNETEQNLEATNSHKESIIKDQENEEHKEKCKINEENCKINEENCKTNEENCKINEENCKINEENCKTNEENCKINEENCKINEENCKINEENCKTNEENCKINEENCKIENPISAEEEPRKEFLLASSAREPNIYIWRAGTDGRMQTFLTIPSHTTLRKPKSKKHDDFWVSLCWVTPNKLLTSSKNAELLQWNLPKPLQSKQSHVRLHSEHWKALFTIKTPPKYLNEFNFMQEMDINVWTTGVERTICNFNLKLSNFKNYYSTLGGDINCLAGSTLDPYRLALGCQDREVKIWNLGRSDKKCRSFKVFYDGIFGAITALAWHPQNENLLAWGTIEGRIGLTVVLKGKKPKILPHYFKSQIFKLEWGPSDPTSGKHKLFAVSEGKVVIFDPELTNQEPELLKLQNSPVVYTMSWKPDYSIFLISTQAQKFVKLDRNLSNPKVCYIDFRLDSFVWHSEAASNEPSKYSQVFASVTKSGIHVFDLSIQTELPNEQIIAKLNVPNGKINGIQWSPHQASYLIVITSEGVAQVFNVENEQVLSTYINPWIDGLLSVYWSPIDKDCVILGTEQRKIVVFKINEHPPLTASEIKNKRNRINKQQQYEFYDGINNNCGKAKEENKEGESKKKSVILPFFYSLKEKTQVADLLRLLNWKTEQEPEHDEEETDILNVYGPYGFDKIFERNLASLKQQGKYNTAITLALFEGDVSSVIKESIEQKRVDPQLIALCPMVSPTLWKTACETYVEQLLEDPKADPLEAVTYLLICHKVEESIDFLCERSMFREAYVLGKTRLGRKSAVVDGILEKWAKHSVYQGNYELAACCFICRADYENGAQWLFRRNDPELLDIAVRLAKLAENDGLCEAIELKKASLTRAFDESDDKAHAETEEKLQGED